MNTKLPPVYVKWIDSNGGHGWSTLDWIKDNISFSICESIGYLLKEDVDYILLVQSIDDNEHGDNFIAIYKTSILEQRPLRFK